MFYIFLDEDAQKMSDILSLKLTNLNQNVLKCGFPKNSLDKYIKILNYLNLNTKIVDTSNDTVYKCKEYKFQTDFTDLLTTLLNVNTDNLSISECYKFIEQLKSKAKEIFENVEK